MLAIMLLPLPSLQAATTKLDTVQAISLIGAFYGDGSGLTNLSVAGGSITVGTNNVQLATGITNLTITAGANATVTGSSTPGTATITIAAAAAGSGIDAATGTNISAYQAFIATNTLGGAAWKAANYYDLSGAAAAAQAASLPLHSKADTAGTADTALAGWPTTWNGSSIYGSLSLTNIGGTNVNGFFSGGGYFTNLVTTNITVNGSMNLGTLIVTQLVGPVASKLLASDASSNVVAATWGDVLALASAAPLTNNNAASVTLTNVANQFTGAFFAPTNGVPYTWVLTAGKGFNTNLTANVTIAGIAGIPANGIWGAYLFLTNSSASTVYTVTCPGGSRANASLGYALPPVFYITNSRSAVLNFHGFGLSCTNVSWEPY